MDKTWIPIIFLFAMIYLSRMITEKANKKLDTEKKAELVDLFSKQRMYSILVMIVLMVGFYILTQKSFLEGFIAHIIALSLLFGYISTSNILNYRKLKQNNFPDFYLQAYMFSAAINLGGFVAFYTAMYLI